jgi:hypothetical protein
MYSSEANASRISRPPSLCTKGKCAKQKLHFRNHETSLELESLQPGLAVLFDRALWSILHFLESILLKITTVVYVCPRS